MNCATTSASFDCSRASPAVLSAPRGNVILAVIGYSVRRMPAVSRTRNVREPGVCARSTNGTNESNSAHANRRRAAIMTSLTFFLSRHVSSILSDGSFWVEATSTRRLGTRPSAHLRHIDRHRIVRVVRIAARQVVRGDADAQRFGAVQITSTPTIANSTTPSARCERATPK